MPMGRVTVTLPAEILSDIDHAESNRSAFILDAVRRELSRRRRLGLRKSLRNPHEESLRNAEAGFDAWAGSPPGIGRCSPYLAPLRSSHFQTGAGSPSSLVTSTARPWP